MKKYRVKPGEKNSLKGMDPKDASGFPMNKQEAEAQLVKLSRKLEGLQEMLFAQHQHKVLIVLQGMDTSGKDGTIRSVFEGVNPQGVRVAGFKAPTPAESDHDYLWRIHQQVPAKGEIVIFNRSHYEDVLVVRVHDIVPKKVWGQRFDEINAFERMLVDEGTTILKFFLHISLEEQKQRLLDRLNDPAKHWKFNTADLAERKLWKEYMRAYEDVLQKTSTAEAPWYIVPADRKWYRNLVVATVLVQALESLNLEYPRMELDSKTILAELE